MVDTFYSNLEWLPRAPEDFHLQLAKAGGGEQGLGDDLRSLARCSLDLNQATSLAKVVVDARAEGRPLVPLEPFRLAVLSNATSDLIVPALIASAARHGIALQVLRAGYDQVMQEALNPDSSTNRSRPDAVLLAIDHRALPLDARLGDADSAAGAVKKALDYLLSLRTAIRNNSGAFCIFQTLAPMPEPLFGSLDRAVPGTHRNALDRINLELTAAVRDAGETLLDCAGLAETVGLANWHDPRLWNLGKMPFACDFIPLYAEHVARIIAATRGKTGKVLVLDLDNTVWGGVIGDDGLEGIKLAQGDPSGEAHLAVQRMALDLRRRGILLAVSSKNFDAVAREPFLKHPEMLLRLEHIAVFRANWDDKANNLRAIAAELSLGIDSLVLLDDNPVERGLVRALLPEVGVPELPDDPAFYARALAAAGYFESVSLAAEDLKRAEFYRENAQRSRLESQCASVDAYLASLEMRITFQPFDQTGRARIVQLINKSNQYNLTTRRYTDPEVAAAELDENTFTLQVRLADIFGDNGMISAVICRPAGEKTWEIDTWLMSCRVLGRKVEQMVLREILSNARARGITRLVGVFLPSGRNTLVVDHYQKLGFTKLGEEAAGATHWELLVEGPEPEKAPMTVHRPEPQEE